MDVKIIDRKIKEKYKKALVTGAAGFIGSHIAEKLLQLGIAVIGVDDYSAGKLENTHILNKYDNYTDVKCDITDYKELKKHFDGVEVVFHNAASKKNICLTDPRRDLEVNGEGAFNIFELSRDFGIKKVVHASTGSVYGEAQYFPQDEDHPLDPTSYYGVSKLAGERYGKVFNGIYGLDVTILRYFHVYGPRQESHPKFGGVVPIFMKKILEGENPVIYGDGSQQRSFTNVKDLVNANLLVAISDETSGNAYNCASGIKVTVQELCDYLIDYFGQKGILYPEYEDWQIGDIKVFDVSNRKLSDLGMSFEKDFWNGLTPTLDWMKSKF